jgi:hypothetical protein
VDVVVQVPSPRFLSTVANPPITDRLIPGRAASQIGIGAAAGVLLALCLGASQVP